MGQQQSQEQVPQQKSSKLLNWIDQRFIGPIIGALIAAIAAGRIVIQITGVQFNIGLLVLITLVRFAGIHGHLGQLLGHQRARCWSGTD